MSEEEETYLSSTQANKLYSELMGKDYASNHNIVGRLRSHGYTVATGSNGRSIIKKSDVVSLSKEPKYKPGYDRDGKRNGASIQVGRKIGTFVNVDYQLCRKRVIDKWEGLGVVSASQFFDELVGELP